MATVISAPKSNPYYIQIPQPVAEVGSLAYAMRAIKQNIEVLTGNRGTAPHDRAVLFSDLVSFGLIDSTSFILTPTGFSATPAGPAGGDLSATYPDPVVSKIVGVPLGLTTATAGNLLIASGTAWVTKPISGDLSLTAAGATTVGKINGVALGSTTATSGNLLIGSGTAWVTHGLTGDLTLSNAGAAVVTQINGVGLGSTTATSGNLLIGSGTQWVTHALSGDLTVGSTGTTTVAKVNGVAYGTSPATNTLPLVTAANTVTYTATSQIPGTATNDDATTANIGSFVTSTVLIASEVALATGVAKDVTSISLTAGDWDVWGGIDYDANAATVITRFTGWISATSATQPTRPTGGIVDWIPSTSGTFANGTPSLHVVTQRFSLSTTTTVYLSTSTVFGTNTLAAYGIINARRRR